MPDIPAPNARFKPRAEAALLSRLVQDAWQDYQAQMFPTEETAEVGERLAAHLTARYPAADMYILSRYGCCSTVSDIVVQMYSANYFGTYGGWGDTIRIDLGRPILIPSRANNIYCGGPRWSEDPTRGVTEAYRAESIAKGEWEKFCADQDASDAALAPREVEPYFAKIMDGRRLYRAEYKQATAFPAEQKQESGEYPTWGALADKFPVLGGHIASLRAAS